MNRSLHNQLALVRTTPNRQFRWKMGPLISPIKPPFSQPLVLFEGIAHSGTKQDLPTMLKSSRNPVAHRIFPSLVRQAQSPRGLTGQRVHWLKGSASGRHVSSLACCYRPLHLACVRLEVAHPSAPRFCQDGVSLSSQEILIRYLAQLPNSIITFSRFSFLHAL